MSCGGYGIICEYNPFHSGHKYQIEKVKELGADYVVCVMSGDFVQRAEPSFQDKSLRAMNAVKNGADIVLELPFPYSSMSAEGFAKAGTYILSKSGLCSHIAFGSECANTEMLSKTASALTTDFSDKVIAMQKEKPSLSFARAREELIAQQLGKEYADILQNPNDILGVEYIKACSTLENPLIPVPIKRSTPRGGFDDDFASSSFIRKSIISGNDTNFALSKVPKNTDVTQVFGDLSRFYSSMLINLMLKTPEQLSQIAEIPSGCEYSIIKCAKEAKSIDELINLLSSKTLTYAKIRRMLLFAFFDVTKKMAEENIKYTSILALSDKGKAVLREKAENSEIILASRVSDIKRDKDAFTQYNFSRNCREVLLKCLP